MHPPETGSANVPSFITKLWTMVNERKYEALITWSPDGRSFHIRDQSRFAKEVLPHYFKHSNMGSFVRQLNMYGFRKMTNIENCGLRPESDDVSFRHPDFVRGQERQLLNIRRKKNHNNAPDAKSAIGSQQTNGSSSQVVSMPGTSNDVQNQLVAIMQRQDSLDKFRSMIQQENAAIWKEIAFLRRQNNEQQNVIQNLIKFLISLVPQMRNMSGKRKSSLISSMANSMPESKRLNTGSQSSSPASPPDSFSLDTIRNGIIDAIRNGLSNTSESAGSSNGVMIQDVTNDDLDEDVAAGSNNTIIAHSSNSSDSPPILTESDMDLLSQICKQLNLVPPSGKKGSGRDSDTVSAKNIVEVPEDFMLEPEEVVAVDDLAELADNVEDLFSTSETPITDVGDELPADTKEQLLLGDLSELPMDQHLDQPLNDPLDLQSLDLGVDSQEDFVLPDLSTSLVDDADNFTLLL